ncbi:hypothetical protein H5V43_18525 [Sphingobium fuliginis]|jgi:hypothetical protein|uniref:Uncharacterized protein n=2 Tax=Sphingobium fuliginis (strain ATCC 27551) TaxID=336203 RepID=A0A7M2GNM2_SPHSA|nr:hypothetical protein [Sphingobium sp. YBL2]QOT74123.1 hypothetical protein H5V43_18525 [Sphingobium fuliginis]
MVQTALDTRPYFDPATARYECRIAMSDYCLHVVLPHLLRYLTVNAPGVGCAVNRQLFSGASHKLALHSECGQISFPARHLSATDPAHENSFISLNGRLSFSF